MTETKRTYNKPAPDPRNLLPGEVGGYGRQSISKEKASKSLRDQKTCSEEIGMEQHLPYCAETDWYEEPRNHGGNLWWEGGGSNGLTDGLPRKYRRMLTKLLRDIQSGKIRAIVVYSVDRIWRSVSICEAAIDFLYDHNCLCYDRNGMVNYWSLEGRNSVLQNAVVAQYQREYSAVHAPRGVTKSRDKGKMVVTGRVQGFLAKGGKSGEVEHLDEEQDIVNWAFRMFDLGDGNGPLTTYEIANRMIAEGKRLYHQTQGRNPHGFERLDGNEGIVYEKTIRRMLQDTRYIAFQTVKGVAYPCNAFRRPDGSTVVDEQLFRRVQEKIAARKRSPRRNRNNRPLAGLVRCGVDGEALTAQQQYDDPTVGHWIMRRKRPGCRCVHTVVTIRENTLDAYIAEVLAPILLEEIESHRDTPDGAVETQRADLARRVAEEETYRAVKLVEMSRSTDISPFLLGQMENESVRRLNELRSALAAIDTVALSIGAAAPTLKNLMDAPAPAVRDAVRMCLYWIAVFRSPSERTPKPGNVNGKYSYAPEIMGKLVFLLATGQYHTAVIYRERYTDRGGYFPFRLRPALPEEVIGGVADFPDPAAFIGGLTKAFDGNAYPFGPHQIAPGYPRPPLMVIEEPLATAEEGAELAA